MAEAAGLSLAAIALVSAFKDCIDLLSYISAAKSMPTTYARLLAKLELEKVALLLWAERVGLGAKEYDKRLDNESIRPGLHQAFTNINNLFSDASAVENRYGLKVISTTESADNDGGEMVISSGPKRGFDRRFNELTLRRGIDNAFGRKAVTVFKKVRWAVHDKELFQELLNELAFFTNKVYQLVPDHRGAEDAQIQAVLRTLREIKDTRVVLDACIEADSTFTAAAKEQHVQNCRKRITDIIWFRSMDERRDAVTSPYPLTYDWALDRSQMSSNWSDIPSWLRNGSGIYWVAGKAAAGKSTLMKYLLYHQTTQELLHDWAEDDELTVASFFFRNLGTEDQRSHAGLCRALLYNILHTDPSQIAVLLPTMWREAFDQAKDDVRLPSSVEVRNAFARFAQQDPTRKYCFFIDGLDEYEGDYRDCISLLQDLSRSPSVKIVVSSRPITPCYDAFHHCPMLELQHLNSADIEKYVLGTIFEHPSMKQMQRDQYAAARKIRASLVEKSEGVFLWVVLACRSLEDGFAAGDYIQELLLRVEELPKELEGLFKHILCRLEPEFQAQAVDFLQIAHRMQQCQEGVDLLMTLPLAIAAQNMFDPSHHGLSTMTDSNVRHDLCQRFQRRLRSRCRGLLEVVPRSETAHGTSSSELCLCHNPLSHDVLIDSTVRFLHRTLFEYIDTSVDWPPEGLSQLDSTTEPSLATACVMLEAISASNSDRIKGADRLFWSSHLVRALQGTSAIPDRQAERILERIQDIAIMFETTGVRTTFFFNVYNLTTDALNGKEPDADILLAITLGMSRYIGSRLTRRVNARNHQASPRPWLSIAVCQEQLVVDVGILPRCRIIATLLSAGYDPNEASHTEAVTPWNQWLTKYCATPSTFQGDSMMTCAVIETTAHFILHGAAVDAYKYKASKFFAAEDGHISPRAWQNYVARRNAAEYGCQLSVETLRATVTAARQKCRPPPERLPQSGGQGTAEPSDAAAAAAAAQSDTYASTASALHAGPSGLSRPQKGLSMIRRLARRVRGRS